MLEKIYERNKILAEAVSNMKKRMNARKRAEGRMGGVNIRRAAKKKKGSTPRSAPSPAIGGHSDGAPGTEAIPAPGTEDADS